MIRVLCLNPVIDRMYYVDDFLHGNKFFEVRPDIYIGGKGINIARVMRIMGEPCELYGFVGGSSAELIREEARRYGIIFHEFPAGGETRTTINIIDTKNQRETEITEPGPGITPDGQEHFLGRLESDLTAGDMVVCSGIPMNGMSEQIYQMVSRLCEYKQCRCILDATGVYLKGSFPGKYFFSKPNFPELCELFSITEEENERNIIACGKKLLESGVENLLISTGKQGGYFLNGEMHLKASIPETETVSTIGSGDAAVAGFCVGVRRGLDPEACVRLAMACGVSNATFSKVGFVDPVMVDQIFSQIQIRRLG